MKQEQLQDVLVEVHPIIWKDFNLFYATSFSMNDFENMLIDSAIVTESELQDFLDDLQCAQQRGFFYASGNIVVAAGIKPA